MSDDSLGAVLTVLRDYGILSRVTKVCVGDVVLELVRGSDAALSLTAPADGGVLEMRRRRGHYEQLLGRPVPDAELGMLP